MSMKSFLADLAWRGLIADQTPGLTDRLAAGPISGYVGFDPTAVSLQVGNLVPIMLLAHLQRAGGRPIVVVGGGTGRIGDPSGKRAERPLLEDGALARNLERQRRQFGRFFRFGDGPTDAIMVDNAEWLVDLNLVTFLRDIGKHFTLSYMLQKESVKGRLESGISFTEFSYMLLQAYDFLQVRRRYECALQMGGSDQWGNITAGIELIRRLVAADAHGLTAPLVTTSSGMKFGKSEGEAVWLDPDLTSPYAFHQFWINTDDHDVGAYLRMFTFLPRDAIDGLMERHDADRGARIPHRALADDVTARVHGAEAAQSAEQAARVLFGELDPRDADAGTWRMLAAELPCAELDLTEPVSAVDLVTGAGLAKSRGEARRLVDQNGVTRNGVPLTLDQETGPADALAGGYIWLRRGKKTDALVVTSGR